LGGKCLSFIGTEGSLISSYIEKEEKGVKIASNKFYHNLIEKQEIRSQGYPQNYIDVDGRDKTYQKWANESLPPLEGFVF